MKEVAFLPGIGKFCKCGCGKKIESVKVTRRLKNGNKISFIRQPQKNKVFATLYCKLRYFSRKGQNKYRLTLSCGVTLSKQGSEDRPYRIMTIYGKQNNQTAKFTITKLNHKLLWDYLDKIEEFRSYKNKLKIQDKIKEVIIDE